MKSMAAGFGTVALIAMWVATPVGAQELQRGTWTGTLTPPGGAGVPVTFEVGETAGVLSIVMNNPQLGDTAFNDERLDGRELTFWWEPGVRVNCALQRTAAGGFAGACTGEEGPGGAGRITMVPPAES